MYYFILIIIKVSIIIPVVFKTGPNEISIRFCVFNLNMYFFFQGNITFDDLLSSMPFKNDVGKVITKGSDILAAFEFSVRRYNGKEPFGEFLQVSGKILITTSKQ